MCGMVVGDFSKDRDMAVELCELELSGGGHQNNGDDGDDDDDDDEGRV